MKLLVLTVVLLFPFVCAAQLFPNIVDFHGKIDRITEKRYGKELVRSKKDSGVFKPGKYSGWKYIYSFDEDSKIKRQLTVFLRKVQSESTYKRTEEANRIIVRQKVTSYNDAAERGNCIEYENLKDRGGQIEKVNYWSVDLKNNTRQLFLVESDARYREAKLLSFVRHNVNEKGEPDTGERCDLIYDNAGRLIRIERKDNETDTKTILSYSYNPNGFLDHYSVDFMVGMPVWGKNPKQDIYYKCDRQGNWVRKYWYAGQKRHLEARRIVKYKKLSR